MPEATGALRSPMPSSSKDTADYQVTPFYIPATDSQQERRLRNLKQGDLFAVFDYYGDIIPGENNPDGLYFHDTRYLSSRFLLMNESRPLLLSSTMQDNNTILTVDLTNPDVIIDSQVMLPKDTIHITRSIFLMDGACYERIHVLNFNDKEETVALTLAYSSDFADLFEVRGMKRDGRGTTRAWKSSGRSVRFDYAGLDHTPRAFVLEFDPKPKFLDQERARYELTLPPHGRCSLYLRASCLMGDQTAENKTAFAANDYFSKYRQVRHSQREVAAGMATVDSSNKVFNEVITRSAADLFMLMTETPKGLYPYAGIPWYSTVFGRDGIITAMEMLWAGPEVAKGVLRYLAAYQATALDPASDAEPGKILHEVRDCEMARTGEVPFRLYYGSVDSTPLYVLLAARYFERTGDLETIRQLWPNLEAALGWIDHYGDPDGDGLIEYMRQNDNGLTNQCWKDSVDSVFHADGQLAQGPLALCEVQGYVYAAKRELAPVVRLLGYRERADQLEAQAAALKTRFNETFWIEEMGLYALALDKDKKPCRVRSSNAGQVLFSGIADDEQARKVADAMIDQSFFSGWGIRTIALGEARYNPMSYHNGSVWPHDNAVIAMGMARYHLKPQINRVFTGLFEAASYMEHRRLPELFCGFRRRTGNGPTSYPVACSPQAWAAATPFAMLQACLGISFDAAKQEIHLLHPSLPPFLDRLVLSRLRIGETVADIAFHRHGDRLSVDILAKEGPGEVLVRL